MFEAMIPYGNQCGVFRYCQSHLIGLILTCFVGIYCNAQGAYESIQNADTNHAISAINDNNSGPLLQLMNSRGLELSEEMDQFDEEPTSLRELDTLFWHRSDEELSVGPSVGMSDGYSDEELSLAPSYGYSDEEPSVGPSVGPSAGYSDEELSPGPSVGYFNEELSPGSSVGYSQRVRFDVRFQFGAVGDGITNDTDAFLAAWAMACRVKNAEVYVPSGYTFLVYPSTYSGPCQKDLHFAVEGTIIAPMEISAWAGRNVRYWFLFQKLANFTLLGGGTFNGRGQNWWACKRNKTCPEAPNAVTIYRSSNVTTRYVTFVDSAQIHINFQYVTNGHAKGLQIQAPWSSPNTDGIHISGTTNFVVQMCNVSTGDDCVSIVSGSHNIAVRDTYCGKGCHGISVGSLGANGEHANVTQVQVKNCQLESTTNGLRVKTWQGGTGIASNFEFRNIEMKNVSNPIIIDQYYCPPSQISEPCTNFTDNVQIDLIKFTNIWGTSASSIAVKLACSESVPCTNIRLKDINITRVSGSPARATCTNAFGMAEGTQFPPSCFATNSLYFTPLTLSLASFNTLLQRLWGIVFA